MTELPIGEPGGAGGSGGLGSPGKAGEGGQGGVGGAGGVGGIGQKGDTGERGADAPGTGRRLLVIFGIVVVAFAALGLGYQRLDSVSAANTAGNARDACLAGVLGESVEAQAETASLASQTSAALRKYVHAAVEGKNALADALAVVLDEATTPEVAIAALERAEAMIRNAGKVGSEYEALSMQLADARREHPVPTIEQVNACLGER